LPAFRGTLAPVSIPVAISTPITVSISIVAAIPICFGVGRKGADLDWEAAIAGLRPHRAGDDNRGSYNEEIVISIQHPCAYFDPTG
jgi:hypothetical protein